MYERFTDRARKVMQLANQEAQRFNHDYIGTEHILLGLVKEGSGVAANVLKNLDVDLHKIRLEIEEIVQSGPALVSMGKLPQTPRAKKVIELAVEEARNLGHNYVGTEHLLLGLVREEEGVGAQVLLNLGVHLADVRGGVLSLLGHAPSGSDKRKKIDPTTCEREYSSDEIAFMTAMDIYKRAHHRPFPTWSEVLEVLCSLGYRRVAEPAALPGDPGGEMFQLLDGQIQQRELEKKAAVEAQDFETAAALRDEVNRLKKLRKKWARRSRKWEDEYGAASEAKPRAEAKQFATAPAVLKHEFLKIRSLLGLLAGALAGALIDPPMGAVLGAALGGVAAAFGGVVGGILVGFLPGALLGYTYLGGDVGPVAGSVLGAVVGGSLGSIGRPSPFRPCSGRDRVVS